MTRRAPHCSQVPTCRPLIHADLRAGAVGGEVRTITVEQARALVDGRGLHSFPFQLNLSTLCGIRGCIKGLFTGYLGV